MKKPVDSTTISAPTLAQSSLAGVALGEDFDGFAVDDDGVFGGGDFVFEVAEDGVVLEQVGEGGRGGEVVDRDELDVRVAEGRAKDVAADAAEAVNSYFHCHALRISSIRFEATKGDTHGQTAGVGVYPPPSPPF